jgi:plastocyanin
MRKGMWSAAAAVVLLVAGTGVLWGGIPALADSRVSMVDSDSDIMKWHFDPADVSIPVGSSVAWHNGGAQPHTVTADDGKSFSSPTVPAGGDFQFKFTTPGDFAYHCDPHPWMKAVVHVTGASTPTTASTTTTATTATTAPGSPATTTTTAAGASTSSTTTTTTAAGAATTTTLAPAVTPTSAPDSASSTTTTTARAGSAEGAEGAGKHSTSDKSSPIGIAFAAVSTLLVGAVSVKLLASKP